MVEPLPGPATIHDGTTGSVTIRSGAAGIGDRTTSPGSRTTDSTGIGDRTADTRRARQDYPSGISHY